MVGCEGGREGGRGGREEGREGGKEGRKELRKEGGGVVQCHVFWEGYLEFQRNVWSQKDRPLTTVRVVT